MERRPGERVTGNEDGAIGSRRIRVVCKRGKRSIRWKCGTCSYWGDVWLGRGTLEHARTGRVLASRLPSSRKGTDWLAVLKPIVLYRLANPGNELRITAAGWPGRRSRSCSATAHLGGPNPPPERPCSGDLWTKLKGIHHIPPRTWKVGVTWRGAVLTERGRELSTFRRIGSERAARRGGRGTGFWEGLRRIAVIQAGLLGGRWSPGKRWRHGDRGCEIDGRIATDGLERRKEQRGGTPHLKCG